jgi:hypothetical protein
MRRIYCQVLKETLSRHNSRVEGEKWTHWKYARQIAHNGRAGLRIWLFSLVSMAVVAGPKHGWVTSAGAFSPRLWQGLRTRRKWGLKEPRRNSCGRRGRSYEGFPPQPLATSRGLWTPLEGGVATNPCSRRFAPGWREWVGVGIFHLIAIVSI